MKLEVFFVKFHWKPKLGTHAVAWDEAKKFQERISIFTEDLWEAIETGNFPNGN
jgi:catalase